MEAGQGGEMDSPCMRPLHMLGGAVALPSACLALLNYVIHFDSLWLRCSGQRDVHTCMGAPLSTAWMHSCLLAIAIVAKVQRAFAQHFGSNTHSRKSIFAVKTCV